MRLHLESSASHGFKLDFCLFKKTWSKPKLLEQPAGYILMPRMCLHMQTCPKSIEIMQTVAKKTPFSSCTLAAPMITAHDPCKGRTHLASTLEMYTHVMYPMNSVGKKHNRIYIYISLSLSYYSNAYCSITPSWTRPSSSWGSRGQTHPGSKARRPSKTSNLCGDCGSKITKQCVEPCSSAPGISRFWVLGAHQPCALLMLYILAATRRKVATCRQASTKSDHGTHSILFKTLLWHYITKCKHAISRFWIGETWWNMVSKIG